jgi:hypothetical protein
MKPEINQANNSNPATKSSLRKQWTIPYSKGQYKHLRVHNEVVERMFMQIIKCIKTHYLKPNELVFEHDSRKDRTLNSSTMHSFITKNLFLELECTYGTYECVVLYDFQDCSFEQEVRKLLRPYPLSVAAKHAPRTSGVTAYFNRVYQFQNGKHFYHI